MRNQSWVKREFLRRWMSGFKNYSSSQKNMSLLERKNAIKLSADLAMASTRDNTTRWSRALIAASAGDESSRVLTEHVIGSSSCHKVTTIKKSNTNYSSYSPLCCSRRRRMLRRIRTVNNKGKERVVTASFVAKRLLVRKRTRRLKSLLPGGELIDNDVSLIEETLDYVQSLIAQVEVMRGIVNASEIIIKPS